MSFCLRNVIKHAFFRSFIPEPEPPDPLTLALAEIEAAYPSDSCSAARMCPELAKEWAADVCADVAGHTLRYHNPEPLPDIDFRNRSEEEDGNRKLKLAVFSILLY